MDFIKASGISKSYKDKKILKDINLKLESGQVLSVVGNSGSGKSTLLKILSGIIEDFEGNIFLNDKDITKLPMKDRKFILMFQDDELFPHMTIFDNVAFGLKMENKDKAFIEKEVNKYLNLVSLIDHKNKYPSQLSGGEKQRIALARSLIVKPKMLLLDEPFTALDPSLRQNLRQETFKIIKDQNIPTIFVSHDINEAVEVADKLAILSNGKFVAYDNPRNIFENPRNLATARFIFKDNIIENKLIKKSDIDLVPGSDYKIIDKLYKGDYFTYRLVNDDYNILVDSRKEYSINDRINAKIKRVIELEEEWKK